MTTQFPTSLDNFTNPTGTDLLENSNAALDHDLQHSNANDAIEALQAKVGADSSAVTTSHDYKLSEVTSSDKAVGKTATQTLTNKTLTSPKVNVGSDATADMWYRGADGTLTRIPIGSSTQILTSDGSTPSWQNNASGSDASTTVKGVVEEATQSEVDAGTTTGGTGARLFVNPGTLTTYLGKFRFGGTGADGALSISSGTTTIDLGSAAIVVKNYTSISITGTGKLAFSNPNTNGTIVILKSQGGVTLTSSQTPMIDASSLGGAGGSAVTATSTTSGNNGSGGTSTFLATGGGQGATSGAAGTGGTLAAFSYGGFAFTTTRQKYTTLPIASGGGSGAVFVSGGANSGTSGAGGRGGGTLVIECAGAWNFTTTSGISVAGANGGTGTSTGGDTNSSGGGGGAGGFFLGIYNTLTSNSGTVTVTGGTGGNSDNNNTFQIRRGGGGGALIAAGTSGASSNTNSDKTGGDGATGTSVVVSNNDFT